MPVFEAPDFMNILTHHNIPVLIKTSIKVGLPSDNESQFEAIKTNQCSRERTCVTFRTEINSGSYSMQQCQPKAVWA